jgi:hypothetical protein
MRRADLALISIALAVAGCDASTGVDDNRFTLTSVMGQPLPTEYREFDFVTPALEITGGSLVVRADGTLTEEHNLRCRDPLPPDVTECTVTSGGQFVREGTYSATERWVRFGEARFAAQFDPDRVLIAYGLNPARPILFVYEK